MSHEFSSAVKRALVNKDTEEEKKKQLCVQLEDLPQEVQGALMSLEAQNIALNLQREGFLARLKDNERTIAQLQCVIANLNQNIAHLTRNNLKKECLRCERQLDDAAIWAMFDAIDSWASS
jgi:hypothetical protein